MALSHFGFIVIGAGLDPSRHRCVMDSGSFTMIAVGVGSPHQAPMVARGMVDEGIQLIELCGGFGHEDVAAVSAAVRGSVPLGCVAYGPDAIRGLFQLFQPGE